MISEIKKFQSQINKADGVIILSHIDPDLDSLGSGLALKSVLLKRPELAEKVYIWSTDKIKKSLRFLPFTESIVSRIPDSFCFDTVIVLDSSTIERVKDIDLLNLNKNHTIINIDHHIDNILFGDINIVDPARSSTGELMFTIFEHLNWEISPDIAGCLYAAITSDTGRFLFSNTTADTFKAVAKLVQLGADNYNISQSIYENKSLDTFKLINFALSHLVVNDSLSYAYTMIPSSAPKSDIVLVDIIRQLQNINIFLVFQELEKDKIKINLRSKRDFDVSRFASVFGGGGHKNAAGIRLKGSMMEIKNQVIARLEKTLK
ncbi:MAG: bifunctional oligoribonuclease/PAP phosphatase NrnA [bacterium]|nr:bifunctional oligoribonuclease/PAP phosphatase NrnA [bacterium]